MFSHYKSAAHERGAHKSVAESESDSESELEPEWQQRAILF